MRVLALLLILVAPLVQGGATPIVGPPSIPYETVLRVLALRPASPLLPLAPEIWTVSQQASVDVAFALAIWLKESEFGTTGVSITMRNPGNLTCTAADPLRRSGCSGRWATYARWNDAVADWFAYIERRYVAQGLTTVEAILPIYAPPGENDTAVYIAQVTSWLRDWNSGAVGMDVPGTGSTIREQIMDDWVQRPIDELKYWVWRGVASLLWGDLQAGLSLCDLLARFQRVLVTQGFVPAIELVAHGLLGIAVPVFTLGLTLSCLLLILLPVARLTHWVNGRTLLALLLGVPVLFGVGVAGSLFQQLEQLRLEIGTLIYTGVFQASSTHFDDLGQPITGTGQTQSMCPLTPFNPAVSPALHADAVAAAYVCADYADVVDPDGAPPSDLPDEFAHQFFLLDSATFATADAAQREQQLATAATGVGRMAYGHVLVALAVTEQLTNVLWTLGLGTLFLSLLFVLLFSWFRPYEYLTAVLGGRLLQVMMTCWILSAIGGLLMAALLKVAADQYAPLVLGAGIGVLLLSLVILWIAGQTVFGALGTAWTAMSSGGPPADGGVRWAGSAIVASAGIGLGRASRSAHPAPALMAPSADAASPTTWREHASSLGEAAIGYRMARQAGNSPDYAAGYAVSQFRPLARLGTLATAMGAMSPDFAQGLTTAYRATHGRDDLLNPVAQRLVRRDGAAATASKMPPPSKGTP